MDGDKCTARVYALALLFLMTIKDCVKIGVKSFLPIASNASETARDVRHNKDEHNKPRSEHNNSESDIVYPSRVP